MCRLRKFFYGLKQSSRAWFSRFNDVILSMEFVWFQFNHTCFICRRPDGRCIIFLVYVDDIILTGDDALGISQVKRDLGKGFYVKVWALSDIFLALKLLVLVMGSPSLSESTL